MKALWLALAVSLPAGHAWAHEPSESNDEARQAPEVSEQELRELTESLNADKEADDTRAEKDAPPPKSQPSAASTFLQSLNPDMSLILDVAGAYFSQPEPLQLGAHDPNHTGFTLQQLELHVSSNIDPFFRLDANIVFALFGVEVEEAYGTTLSLPWNLQMRAGQFLTRFGRINPTHPHSWSFVDQPLVNGKFFGAEGNRGLGVEGSWLVPVPWFAEAIVSTTEAVGDCCARSFYASDDLGVHGPQDLLITGALKQFFPLSDNWSMLWGLSGQTGPNATGHQNRSEIYGTDLFVRYRPTRAQGRTSLSFTMEAMLRRRQVPRDVLVDHGAYAQLVWQADQNWEAGVRYDRVSGVENDYLDADWPSARQRVSAQATYYPSHFSRLRLQGTFDDPTFRPEPIWAVFLALELLAGAHGSHAY